MLYSEISPHHTLEVLDLPLLGKGLKVDEELRFTEADVAIFAEMAAHAPAFLHPDPKRALVLGGGDGALVRELLKHSSIEQIIVVDEDQAITRVCKEFFPEVAQSLSSPRVKLHFKPEQDWVEPEYSKGIENFDLILVDQSPLKRINSEEALSHFFENLKAKLNENGIVVLSAESPFFSAETQKQLASNLKQHFKRLHFYNYTNLSLPGGLGSIALACEGWHPVDDLKRERVLSSGLDTDYYNLGIHEGAFMLPEFQKKNLEAHLNPV